jgi:predicted MFS family arabinose efflux permease
MAPVPQVLRVPAFRTVWLASLASNAGSWLQIVAAGWLVLELTGSPAAVGGLAMAARAPAFVLSTWGGSLADRHDWRRIGIVTFLAQGVAALALAVATWAGAASVALIYALTVVLGVGFAIGLPAMLALVPALVDRPLLPQAVSLNAAGINVARLVGPSIGGITLAVAGAGACFALVAALVVLPPIAAARRRGGGSVREALGHVRRDPAPRRLLIGMALFCALAAPLQELAPVIAARLDAGPVGLGVILGAMGGGAVLGAWLLERATGAGLARHVALPLATVCFAGGLAVVAASPWLPLTLVAMAFAGCFWIWLFAGTNTAIQLSSPPELLGRMLGLYQLAVIAPIAVGALLAGALASLAGIGVALGACAVLLAAWGLWSLAHPVPGIDRAPDGQVVPATSGGR